MCVVVNAGNPLTVQTGGDKLKEITAQSMEVEFVVDWSKVTFDDRETLEERLGEEDAEWTKSDCYTKFMEGFNDKSKNVRLVDHETDAPYKYVLAVSKMDCYVAPLKFVPGWASKMWGTLSIIEKATDTPVVVVGIDEAEDGRDFVVKECFGETFSYVGEKIAKLKK